MNRISEIQARLAEINTLLDTASGDDLTALETESRTLLEELNTLQQEAQSRQQLRQQIADGAGNPVPGNTTPTLSAEQRAADAFAQSRRMTIGADQSRAVLVSGGQLLQPTKTDGINDIPGAKVSSIIDLVRVDNCTGMGSDQVAYVVADMDAAANQTEGGTVSATQPTFGTVTITPTSHLVISQISDQAKKQTNLQYSAKVREQALLALRKKASEIVTAALKASELNGSVNATVTSGKGVIDATTLRNLTLRYGDDESVLGGAVLFLNKRDLIAFGDVRGTSEKKAIYTITPDGANPNTGTISEGGVVVRYCLNSHLTALSGTAQTSTAIPTMYYGNPMALKLDLFGDYEVKVSEDFAFDKRMDTIRGAVDMGAGVVQKNAFIALTIPASA